MEFRGPRSIRQRTMLSNRTAADCIKRHQTQADTFRACPRRVPPTPGHHKSARFEPLPSRASLAKDIAVFEIALGELEHGCVADRTDLQPSDIGAAERCCGGGCARSNYIDQFHSEAEKFRHRH